MFIFTAQDPGPWQYFVHRPDNIGLPLNVVTDKYLTEQINFDNQYSEFLAYQNWLNVQPKGQAAGAGAVVPTGDEEWSESSTPWDEAVGTWDA